LVRFCITRPDRNEVERPEGKNELKIKSLLLFFCVCQWQKQKKPALAMTINPNNFRYGNCRYCMPESRKRNLTIPTIAVFLLLPVSILITPFNQDSLDGGENLLFRMAFKSDTEYSQGYTEKKFASIKHGMTEKQVLLILGKPLKRRNIYNYPKPGKESDIFYEYSWSPANTHYRRRYIHFENGRVTQIQHYFYID
jgi:hypothetical protein